MIKDINNIDPVLFEQDDRIEAYLKDRMSAEEEQQFMKELNDNPKLKQKAIVTARLVKGLKQVGAAQDKETKGVFLASSTESVQSAVEKAFHAEDVSATTSARTISIRRASTWLSIAASLLFIVWLGFEYNDYRNTVGLGEEYGNAFVRGDEPPTDAEKKLESLFANVKNGDNLDNAIHELSLCWELSTMETYNDYTNYSAEIGWNLAIAYLKDNNKKDAKNVLDKLIAISEEGSAINIKAKELLNIINK
jgi:hypothetical protein